MLSSLEDIIVHEAVYPVYQPVISLKNGDVLGYEALSRVAEEGVYPNIEVMFQEAEQTGKIWRLEQICRKAALSGIHQRQKKFEVGEKKLFLNVSPKVLHDEKFRAGFTKDYISRYGMNTENIIFEITEREQIENESDFYNAVEHYKIQNYRIAIDDVGAAYSGLNRICCLSPNYIKLDIALVREVYKNPLKYAMIKGLVEFSAGSGTLLIAEGIENQKELEMLIELGVQFGQGYYLGRPEKELKECSKEALAVILEKNAQKQLHHHLGINRYYIKNVISQGLTVAPQVKVETVLSYIEKKVDAIGICVLENEQPVGVITREKLLKRLSGRYGFSLHSNKAIVELVDRNFLQVEGTNSISNVARMAMEREADTLYDFIVVKEDDKYLGIVTVQALLKKAMEIDVDMAKSANPLTGLPGNLVIEQELRQCVGTEEAYTVYYFDLDNFKAFNDVYGFEKGDEVICILADILRTEAGEEDFVGHIGGDDFIMIMHGYPPAAFAQRIQDLFEEKAHQLYTKEDRIRKKIVTYNRNEIMESFPLVSVTIVSLSNEKQSFRSHEEISNILSGFKKKEKSRKKAARNAFA